MDRGPLLTSAIIFYLSIGAAIFEVLEEPHWKAAKDKYHLQKIQLLKEFPYLGPEGLDKILQVSLGSRPALGSWLSSGTCSCLFAKVTQSLPCPALVALPVF